MYVKYPNREAMNTHEEYLVLLQRSQISRFSSDQDVRHRDCH